MKAQFIYLLLFFSYQYQITTFAFLTIKSSTSSTAATAVSSLSSSIQRTRLRNTRIAFPFSNQNTHFSLPIPISASPITAHITHNPSATHVKQIKQTLSNKLSALRTLLWQQPSSIHLTSTFLLYQLYHIITTENLFADQQDIDLARYRKGKAIETANYRQMQADQSSLLQSQQLQLQQLQQLNDAPNATFVMSFEESLLLQSNIKQLQQQLAPYLTPTNLISWNESENSLKTEYTNDYDDDKHNATDKEQKEFQMEYRHRMANQNNDVINIS